MTSSPSCPAGGPVRVAQPRATCIMGQPSGGQRQRRGSWAAYHGTACGRKGFLPITTTDGPSGIRLQYYCSLFALRHRPWPAPGISALVESLSQALRQGDGGKGQRRTPGPRHEHPPQPPVRPELSNTSRRTPSSTGRMAAAAVQGIQKNGGGRLPQTLCLQQPGNQPEPERLPCYPSGRLREIYLKAFEICVEESRPPNYHDQLQQDQLRVGTTTTTTCAPPSCGKSGATMAVSSRTGGCAPSVDPDFPACVGQRLPHPFPGGRADARFQAQHWVPRLPPTPIPHRVESHQKEGWPVHSGNCSGAPRTCCVWP